QHGLPLLEPVAVDRLEELHVHQRVTHLHRRVAGDRQQVDLVALVHPLGRDRRQLSLRLAEVVAEGPPLPAGDDHDSDSVSDSDSDSVSVFRLFAKYWSALRVFVSCSPETSTPCPARKARVSAATWKASCVPQRVESSRSLEPSGQSHI